MKAYLIIFLSFWFAFQTFSQGTCDIATLGITSNDYSVNGGQTFIASFKVSNDAGESPSLPLIDKCYYEVGSVVVVVSLPNDGIVFQSFIQPAPVTPITATGPYFNWVYDATEKVVIGINHTRIYDINEENVQLNLMATSVISNIYPSCRTLNLSIMQNPDFVGVFPSNTSTTNDVGTTAITVAPANVTQTVQCVADITTPVPASYFTAPTCAVPVLTVVDLPDPITCEGSRTYTYNYGTCGGSCLSGFTWTYTYIVKHTTHPSEALPLATDEETIACATEADLVGVVLPVVKDVCNVTLTLPPLYEPIKKSQFSIDFSDPVLIGPAAALNTWYTDRYAPFAFEMVSGDRLKQSIDMSACGGCRGGGLDGPFYNTQGRKYDLGAGANYAEIDLYIPMAWQTTGRRMAGFWATAFDALNVDSDYPIIEFISDGVNGRFRVGPADNAPVYNWVDLGLPAGFVYDSWVKLQIRLLPSGEFLFTVGNLNYQTTLSSGNGNIRLGNVILQGHNTASPGVTYDIFWDNFSWRKAYVEPTCEGVITYTYDYTDCAGLVFPWTYTYNVNDNVAPTLTSPLLKYAGTTGTNSCMATAEAMVPAFSPSNAILGYSDNCGAAVTATLTGTATTGTDCSWTVTYTYKVVDACGVEFTGQAYTHTGSDQTIPVITRLGDATVYICQGDTYTDAGATALDNCSGNRTANIVTVNPVTNLTPAGSYMVTYNVMDACGNAATQVTRTVVVRPLPTATINASPATVLQNAPTTPVVTFTGMGGSGGPYTFNYTVQFNADPVGPVLTTAPGSPTVTVSQSNAVVGVFTYRLVSVTDMFGCTYVLPEPKPTATITVLSSCDMSPTIPRPSSASFVNPQSKEGFVQFSNAGPGPTNGTLTFRISNVANFDLLISPMMLTADGIPVINSSGLVNIAPGSFFNTITYTGVIPAGGNIRIGFNLSTVGFGGSTGNMTATIINGTGGDNNVSNNKAVRTYIINAE
jgi:hypothetical protein